MHECKYSISDFRLLDELQQMCHFKSTIEIYLCYNVKSSLAVINKNKTYFKESIPIKRAFDY